MEEAGECGGSAGPAPRRAPLLSAPPLSLSYTGSPGDGPSPAHSSNHAPWLDSREIYDLHRKTRLLCRKRPMGENDGCDGWVLKEPMSARSGEFKKRKSALPKPVRDWNLLRAEGERRPGGLGRVGLRRGCP